MWKRITGSLFRRFTLPLCCRKPPTRLLSIERELLRAPSLKMSNTFAKHLQKLSINDPPVFEGSHPEANVVDLMRNYVADELSKVSGVDSKQIYPALEWTNTLDRGDLLIPVPRLVRQKGINPREIAQEWAEKFPEGELISKVEANGPFVQFFFNPQFLFQTVIPDILTRTEDYGACKYVENKKVLIEFSSPNIAKPFHAGHLRSTIIGGFLSNLYEKCGWEVIRMNYLGDWGKQFGILAVGYERYGDDKKLAEDPIDHLFQVYVRVNKDIEEEGDTLPESESTDGKSREYFKRMENGDQDAIKLWQKFRELSIEKYIGTYARLNIEYDVYSGESQVSKESMDRALKLYDEKGLVHIDRGAKLIDMTRFNKKLGKVIVQKSDGTTLYLTRDIGAAIDRYNKYHFDKMIYVIASQQDLHTAQFFELLKQMGFEWAHNLHHVNFGMVQGMSTRKGTVVFLNNILEETKDKMHEVMKKNQVKYAQVENPDEVADLVGISAVMIQDMQGKRINNYEFKWERMLSFEGDTGPYLQYAHSRLRSMQRNVPDITVTDMENADFKLLQEPAAIALVRLLSQYADVLRNALKTHEPTTVVTYLFKLTHQVSSCYDVLWVAGQTKELATVRLALYTATRQVLSNGMKLLGLTPVERM
ncbi:hypothetical protein ZYGM_002562 [Zygosaccharomyces mellis]|uniref:arginine--tRNA ligase n=1 Tax=Zygosaccharomyces mellis TaxID=42258 RepID=A0A4C2E730_9SACH|nr:hypothetical protein ZYGM_002562 [Zygosaccharomyces mellis]